MLQNTKRGLVCNVLSELLTLDSGDGLSLHKYSCTWNNHGLMLTYGHSQYCVSRSEDLKSKMSYKAKPI